MSVAPAAEDTRSTHTDDARSEAEDEISPQLAAIMNKVELAKMERQKGNDAFKQGDITGALRAYHCTLLMLKGLEAHRFTKPAPIEIRPVAGVDDVKAEATITELPDDAEDAPKEGPAPPETTTEAPAAAEPTPAAAEVKDPPGAHLEAETKQMICLTYSNMAMCMAKRENWPKCLHYAQEALKIDADNRKAKFREAQARAGLGEIGKARELLRALDKAEPDNAVRALLAKIKQDEANREVKAKTQMKGFLNKPSAAGKLFEAAPVDHDEGQYDPDAVKGDEDDDAEWAKRRSKRSQ